MLRTALPLAAVLVAVATCLFIAGFEAVLLVGAVLTLLTGISVITARYKGKSLKPAAVLLVGAVYCLSVCGFYTAKLNLAQSLVGTTQSVTVRVIEEPEIHGDYGRFSLETDGNNGFDGGILGNVRFDAVLFPSDESFTAEEGDILTLKATFSKLDNRHRKDCYPRSIFVEADVENATIIGHTETLYTRCVDIRRAVRECINSYTKGDTAAILEGLLLGGTESMSPKLHSDFKICGVIHVTAVSGMHIGAFCTMTVTLLSTFLNRRKASIIALFPMIFAVMLAGLTPSAIRAGIMCGLTLLANCLLKKTDSLNSLGVAISVMLLFNPYYVSSLSFQLSCSASAGVILFSPYGNYLANKIIKFEKPYITKILQGIILVFVQSVGAVLCTLPFQILEFGFISVIAPIANIFITSAAVYAMTVTIIAVSLHFLPLIDILAEYVFLISSLLADYIKVVVSTLANIPFSYIPFGYKSAVLWMALSLATVSLWFLLDRPGGKRVVSIIISAMLLVSLWSYTLSMRNVTEVAVLDTGSGLCTVVSYENSCVVIGCGDDYSDRYVLRNHLKQRGIAKVEKLLILSDSDICFDGYDSILKEIEPKTVVVPENFGNSEVLEGNVTVVKDGEVFPLDVGPAVAKAIRTKYGCVYEISVANRKIIVGAESYDAEKLGIQNADIVVSTPALPQNPNAKIMVVSADVGFESVLRDPNITVTAGCTVSVKFKEGKGMTVYAIKE